MAGWKLIIEDDAGKTIVVPLARDEITIGRKEGNTIRLTERNVSRFHARLMRQNGQVFIQDCESYTGVRINGDRIRGDVEVREGDLIEIGDYHLALQAEGAQPALAGAQPPTASHPTTPMASATSGAFAVEEDDQFAGDTQRWEPPDEMDSPLLGGLPTEEGGALLPETETQRYTAPHVDEPTREETARIDSTDPTVPGSEHPAPISALGNPVNPFALNNDVTMRTPSAPALRAPSINDPLTDATMPTAALPAAALAPAPLSTPPHSSPRNAAVDPAAQDTLATPSLTSLPGGDDERTEAVHVAPGLEDALVQRARLVALNTVFAGTVLPFDQDAMVIGRTEDNDLVIQHKSVSRNHARIVREGDRYTMHDLGSANGILVNNDEVGSALLSSGDVVELGRVRLRFVEPGEHFELSADDIARARIADKSGDEWDEPGTNITSPLRDKVAGGKKKPPIVAIAIGAAALVLLVVIVLALTGAGEEAAVPEPTKAAAQPAEDDRAAALAQAKIDEAKGYLKAGKPDDARRAAQDAVDLNGGADAKAVLLEAQAAQQAASSIQIARKHLDEGRFEDALVSADALRGSPEAEEAKQIAATAKKKLIEAYVADAQAAHDDDKKAERKQALAALRRHDEARANALESRFDEEDGAAAAAADEERARRTSSAKKPPKKPSKRSQAREQRQEEPRKSPEEIAAEVDALEKQATQALFTGNAPAAARFLDDARKLSPRRATLYRGLGQAYEKMGRQKKAAWAYETYLKYSPGAPDRDLVKKKIQELGGS